MLARFKADPGAHAWHPAQAMLTLSTGKNPDWQSSSDGQFVFQGVVRPRRFTGGRGCIEDGLVPVQLVLETIPRHRIDWDWNFSNGSQFVGQFAPVAASIKPDGLDAAQGRNPSFKPGAGEHDLPNCW